MQTRLQCHQSSNSAVAVLKRMNVLKLIMERDDTLNCHCFFRVIPLKKVPDPIPHFFRLRSFVASDHVRTLLIVSNCKPSKRRVLCIVLQNRMQLPDDFFRQFFLRMVDHIINRPEVMDRLQNIVNRNASPPSIVFVSKFSLVCFSVRELPSM